MRLIGIPVYLAAASILVQGADAQPHNLTFEQRVRAQEAIERVYYSHQDGATRPFEEAVPRAVLEKKVTTYLKESAALEAFWKTPVTSGMLRRELERMAAQTRMPDRLRELYAVLGNDPLLIQEGMARPALVDRLARNFFAYDATIHAKTRQEAELLREDLAQGRRDPRSEHPGRSVVELVRGEAVKARIPAQVGEIGPVQEERETFVTRVVLDKTVEKTRIATFVVPKLSWDEWWDSVADGLEEASVDAVATRVDPLPIPAGDPCETYDTWDNGSLQVVPDGRYRHSAVWTGSLMIVWGGYDDLSYFVSGGRYDPATDTWTPTSTVNSPSARGNHTAIWTGSRMVVWGGYNGSSLLNTGGSYDPATDTWTPTSTINAPFGRTVHTAVWTGSQMIVWGGGSSSTGGRYDPATDTWTPTSTTNAPSDRAYHTAVWTGNLMIVWGGSFGSVIDSGGRYNPATDTWTPTSTINAPTARSHHTAVWTGSLMIVWAGQPASNTGGRYNPATDTWAPTSTVNAPTARSSHAAVWTGSLMVVWGGVAASGTGGRYNPATDAWTPTSMTNAPPGRSSPTAVWTGNLMVVWGGQGSSNTGGRYNPATDTWTPTSTGNGPSARVADSVVWTGSLMIVWGGHGLSYLGTGGRYDPATDTWTPTAMTNAPSGRQSHTVVWTGSRMIVWGGYDGSQVFNSGGQYDPTTDTWTPTSTANAPSARIDHTAVWTGSLMIVWGGFDSFQIINSGGRYDPATDTWTPTSTTNAPSARNAHTAVWTGSLMIVWGGDGPSQFTNSGGRYDPATDTWATTSTANAPLARRDHTAVWTGSLMIVWGGGFENVDEFFYPFNTGGRYNPATDSWTPTTTVSAPSARFGHTAVWTGSLMVVWGGDESPDFNYIVNTGGRYSPATDTWTSTSTTQAPLRRSFHTAVWTGSVMIVWGGISSTSGFELNTGGRYVVDPGLDDDGDGFSECRDCNDGNVAVYPGALEICDDQDNDCDGSSDGFATSCGLGQCTGTGSCTAGVDSCVPGSPSAEVCDGLDNNCDGVMDNVPVPVGSPSVAMVEFGTTAVLGWEPIPGASAYDVVQGDLLILRSTGGDFASAVTGCPANNLGETALVLSGSPTEGSGFFYLVRGMNCGGSGTYDSGDPSQTGSRDAEIAASPASCP